MSTLWQQTLADAQRWRQDFHTFPELGWEEERTAKRIRELLSEWDIPWRECAKTGTVATLNGGASGPRIALRGDIDALPIPEDTGKPYTSRNQGCMHACGHDGHTATLLASARWLKSVEDQLPSPVTLLFQPAEEGGHGAKGMIDDGALDGVNEVFGWHNWPAIPFGKLACPDGIVMCGNGTFTITLKGQGGHASQPELCRDPVLAGSAIVTAMQQIVARRIKPQQAAVVSITSFDAPSAPTVIPQQAVLGGSIRIPDEDTRNVVNSLITEISRNVAHSYGVEAHVDIQMRYQATINHAEQAQKVRSGWVDLFGGDAIDSSASLPIMASEDFSYYLREIPGAFALIGADDGNNHHYPCHSPHYDFNDRLIPMVTALYAKLTGVSTPGASSK